MRRSDQDEILYGEKMYKKLETLNQVKIDSNGWKAFYLDNVTGEKWVEEYLYPEMQAGGPPQLRKINCFPWEE